MRVCNLGCLDCSESNSSICIKCNDLYALNSIGSCIRCLSGCNGACDSKNPSLCISCTAGFELYNNQCRRCPIGCISCINLQCAICSIGYKLISQTINGSSVLTCK